MPRLLLLLLAVAVAVASLGGARADAEAEADAAGVTANDQARVTESVMERANTEAAERQDRQWDTEDRDGGSTIVLMNQNSIEAHEQKRPYGRVLEGLKQQAAAHKHEVRTLRRQQG